MAIRAGLIVQTEFLRLVLRQLLRRQVGVEIVGEGAALAEASRLAAANLLLIERKLCPSAAEALTLLRHCPTAHLILVEDGEAVATLAGVPADRLTLLPAGSATAALDPSLLAERLETALRGRRGVTVVPESVTATPVTVETPRPPGLRTRPALIGIAASTGGPDALQELLLALDPLPCPIVVALHIPAGHTAGLINHLAHVSRHRVSLGETGSVLEPGVTILQGGLDHAVVRAQDQWQLRRVRDGTSVFHPNGDILLSSLARLGVPVAGLILTGMGKDGCAGAQALAAAGYPVLAQRPSTCAVPGMPAAAIAAGAVTDIAPPADLAHRLNGWFRLPLAG